MRKNFFVPFAVCAVAFVLLLGFFSRLCEPKYTGESKEGCLISEYYSEIDAGREHDVVLVGDCEAYSSFVPPILYEKYGIRSFVRGSPSQTMAQSYYLVRETLRYERPRAIVLSVYAMCKSEGAGEAYNRLTLDGMRLSGEKINAVRASVGMDESIMSYYLPLLRFHSRIFQLSGDDLSFFFKRPEISHNGYLMKKGIVAFDSSEDNMKAASGTGEAAVPLSCEGFDYLERIINVCRSSGCELILVKAPVNSWRYPWYDEWDREIEDFAAEHGVRYYNLQDVNIGIDPSHDSYDGGLHLNVYGAEKTSVYFGKVLCDVYGIGGDRSQVWDEKLNDYYKERNNGDVNAS